MSLQPPAYFAVALLGSAVWLFAEEQTDVASSPTAEQVEFFERNVRPVLAENCFKCHGPKEQKGGLRLDSRAGLLKGGDSGPVVVPGKPQESELIKAVNYDADGFQMPPLGKLKQSDIDALTAWVKLGAPWPDDSPPNARGSAKQEVNLAERAKHWSFQPVQPTTPPPVKRGDWPQSPIDHFVLSKLEQAGLEPAPEADKRTLLRRLKFDLLGLPPTQDEIDAFLRDDSPDSFERLVDRCLTSPHYGQRWGRHWLDLVRFAETAGHEFDYEIQHAWPYRDYAIRAFNDDVPYDRFVTEHIAGDLLAKPRRDREGYNESIKATAFYWFSQGKHSPVDIRAEECDRVDNQIDVLGKTFLGLTIACARCHDHKFDAITTRDYYALAGYLQSTRQQFAYLCPESQEAKWQRLVKEYKTASDRLVDRLLQYGTDKLEHLLTAQHARLSEEFGKDVSHPWYAWAVLGGIDSPEKFVKRRDSLLARLRADAQHRATKNANTAPNEWLSEGHAFSTSTAEVTPFIWEDANDARPRLTAPVVAHSGRISNRLQGVVRSETFTIDKRFIHYRVKRVGGKPQPGNKHKNGQIHLIVDEFHMIQDPLWGHLTINTNNDGQFRWYRQDVSKLLGHKAYIEVADEDDGFIVVDRIAFSDDAAPPVESNTLILDALNDADLTSPEALYRKYEALVNRSLELHRSGRSADVANAGAQRELLHGVLELVIAEERPTWFDQAASELAGLRRRLLACAEKLQPFRALAAVDGTAENERVLIRGNHSKLGDEVPRRFVEVFGGMETTPPERGSGRLQLAEQVVDPANPLTARVLVNRLWQHHFGRGLVPTPDNFGRLGQPPSHPELLNWLAAEFIRSGWSIKHMHRLMLNSATYRMSSRPDDEHAETVDPENTLLHRMPVRRLEAEVIRDAMLAISGRLDERMYGPSVLPHLTPFMEGRGRPASGPLDGDGRRSLYISVRRNFLSPMFLAFDYPTPLSTIGRRSVSNVPAQALAMMNNPFVVQQAELWAKRVLAEPHASDAERIERLYEMAFGRNPTDEELTAAGEFLETQGREYNGEGEDRTWADLCHVLWNVKEFVFVN